MSILCHEHHKLNCDPCEKRMRPPSPTFREWVGTLKVRFEDGSLHPYSNRLLPSHTSTVVVTRPVAMRLEDSL